MDHLLVEHVPRVYRFALRLTGDARTAEDLTQETFLRAWQQRHRLREPHAARVWLFRIAANLWRDQLRRDRSPVARAGPLVERVASAPAPDRVLAAQEELHRALQALDALPPRQSEVLYLNACEELTLREIADVLGISTDNAKAQLSLARRKMRELFKDVDLYPNSMK